MLGNTQGGVFLVLSVHLNTSLHNSWHIWYQKIAFISLDSWVRLMSCLTCSQSVLDVCSCMHVIYIYHVSLHVCSSNEISSQVHARSTNNALIYTTYISGNFCNELFIFFAFLQSLLHSKIFKTQKLFLALFAKKLFKSQKKTDAN